MMSVFCYICDTTLMHFTPVLLFLSALWPLPSHLTLYTWEALRWGVLLFGRYTCCILQFYLLYTVRVTILPFCMFDGGCILEAGGIHCCILPGMEYRPGRLVRWVGQPAFLPTGGLSGRPGRLRVTWETTCCSIYILYRWSCILRLFGHYYSVPLLHISLFCSATWQTEGEGSDIWSADTFCWCSNWRYWWFLTDYEETWALGSDGISDIDCIGEKHCGDTLWEAWLLVLVTRWSGCWWRVITLLSLFATFGDSDVTRDWRDIFSSFGDPGRCFEASVSVWEVDLEACSGACFSVDYHVEPVTTHTG
jgi:hypothetical protein